MVQENVEIVRRCYELWASRDFEAMQHLLDQKLEVDLSRNIFNPEVYRGDDAFERLMGVIDETWDDFHIEVQELIPTGDKVVAEVKVLVKGKQSGVNTEMRRFNVWTLEGGRVVRVLGAFQSRAEALETVERPQ